MAWPGEEQEERKKEDAETGFPVPSSIRSFE